MPGLLADVNVQGHLPYLARLMEERGLLEILTELGIALATFPDLSLDRNMNDRSLWNFCQEHRWMLLTDNRNREDENSLQTTIEDFWHEGHLPVLTLANKGRFENSAAYATTVAEDIAEQLVVAFVDGICDQPRIFVPVHWSESGFDP
jgi:hypothetical protein